jgi:GST-like protein
MYQLYRRPGWGSVLVEAQLAWYGMPHQLHEVGDLFASEAARDGLAAINPLAQVPTLILPDGTIMSESAAITLLLAETAGRSTLVPAPGDPARAQFLRWLVFMVANLYPTFTYADDPARFVTVESAREPFRQSVDAYCQKLWHMVATGIEGPWFLGQRFSALDIYVGVMTRWRPRRAWFAAELPAVHTLALAVDRVPELATVWAANFPATA